MPLWALIGNRVWMWIGRCQGTLSAEARTCTNAPGQPTWVGGCSGTLIPDNSDGIASYVSWT